ncbi:MAG: M14 family zinc carboxypeptidase [Dokdonella sp.]
MAINKLCCGLAAFALSSGPALADDWFIEAHYQNPAQIRAVAGEFQHLIIDEKRQTIRVDTDEAGIRLLEDAGMSVTVDMAATAQMRASDLAMVRGQGTESIPGYACYRTVEETYSTIDNLVSSHPGLASAQDIGPTWQHTQNATQGYQMRALRITNLDTVGSDPDRPKMVAIGSIHAREYTPAELLTRMAEWLVNNYGIDAQATWLVDHVDFRFVLEANPDGRKKAESGISWRKNTNTVDGFCVTNPPNGSSQPGIDLNRNFPFHWSTVLNGSSGTKCSLTFRGPTAGSEPETQNLVAYLAGTPGVGGEYDGGLFPDRRGDASALPAPDDYAGLFFDIHSYSKLVLWPWGDTTTPSANAEAFTSIGRRLAYFNGYEPMQAVGLYPTDGTTDDTFYGLLGTPSFTIELGNQFFESCTAFQNTILPANLAALKYAARVAWRPYQLPLGPDVTSISPIIRVDQGTLVTLNAVIDELGYNNSNGVQPTFPIAAANAFVDDAPWDAGAVAIPLQASDGSFDAKTESVTGLIDTTGFTVGRHLVYVQGVNSQTSGGRAGAPDAVFLDVMPPGDSIYFGGFDSP